MFKRCGNPKGAPPGGAPPDASAAHHLLIAAARLPLSEHSYNKPYEYQPMPSEMLAPHVPPPAPCAPEEASAQQQASSSQPASKSSGEDTLFESGVMGLMALFGGGGAPSGAPSTSAPVAAQEHGMRPEEAELGGEYTGESAAACADHRPSRRVRARGAPRRHRRRRPQRQALALGAVRPVPRLQLGRLRAVQELPRQAKVRRPRLPEAGVHGAHLLAAARGRR